MSIKKPKPEKFYECENLRKVELTGVKPFIGWQERIFLYLRDYTAGDKNINHPAWLSGKMYHSQYPYWVQCVGSDDFIAQAEFKNLSDAQKFFEECLDNLNIILDSTKMK